MTTSADRIRQMRAAHSNVDKIDAVVTAYRDTGDLSRALLALADVWPPRSPEVPHDPAPRPT